jgi:competence protein ComEC
VSVPAPARSLLERRWPTFLLLAACGGVATANWVAVRPSLTLAAALGVTLVATRHSDRTRLLSAAVGLSLLGLTWGTVRLDALERSLLSERIREQASARVIVTGPGRSTRFAVRVPVEVRRFGDGVIRERALLELPRGRAPPRGSILELARARLVEPRGPETGFDERGWLARRGVHVVVRATGARVVGRRGGIGGVADRLRAHVEHTLQLGSSGTRLSLLRGFVLGDDDGLPRPLRDAFRASGLAHMTAVSGQNVAIVAGVVGGAAWLAGIGRLGAHLAAIAAIVGYALAVGWEPSVVRAAVAGCVASLAWLASRPDDRWHAMALGALVLLVWQPGSLLEPGFQLSFVAVAAILLAVPRVRAHAEGWPVYRKALLGVAVAVACSVATAPVSWAHFGVVALWSVPANVVAEPAMLPVLALSLTASAVAPVAPGAAIVLTWLAGWCAWWIAACARLFASLPHAQVRSGLLLVVLGLALAAAVAVRRVPRWQRRRLIVACLAASFLLGAWWVATFERPRWSRPSGLRVTFLDVGQGDGILLETADAAVLVDQGPPEASVATVLRRMGLRSLSAIVLTHPQRDHIGGAPDVLRGLRVGAVLHPDVDAPSAEQESALSLAARRGVQVVVVRRGQGFRLGRLALDVLWPEDAGVPGGDPNDRAVVLLARYGSFDLLLTADAESNVTGRLPLPPVEVLKVAHHGSADPGLGRQLAALRPRLAVISVGPTNRYGHPTEETLAALGSLPGLRILRTDRDGAVTVESDGRSLTVRTSRVGLSEAMR